jgi:hypothetical protein
VRTAEFPLTTPVTAAFAAPGTASAATAAMAAMAAVRLEFVTSGHASLAPMGGYTASDAARVATPSAVCRVSHRDRRGRVASFSALAAASAPAAIAVSAMSRTATAREVGACAKVREMLRDRFAAASREPQAAAVGVAVSDARPRGHGGGGTDRMSAIHTAADHAPRPRLVIALVGLFVPAGLLLLSASAESSAGKRSFGAPRRNGWPPQRPHPGPEPRTLYDLVREQA